MALTTSDCSELLSPVRPLIVAASVPSVIAAPSVPGVLAAQLTVAASGSTVTVSVAVAGALRLPSASRAIAARLRVKFVSLLGVTVRPARFQPARSAAEPPALQALAYLAWLRMAANRIALTTRDVRLLAPPACPLMLLFFFNDTATTEIYSLSLHDALPISDRP